MNKVNQSKYAKQYGLPNDQSKYGQIQQKIRENSSEKRIAVKNEMQSPTPFSFGPKTNKDLSPQYNQTRLQERQAIIVEQFALEQYPESASPQTYVDIFVGNMLRLAKSNFYENIADQCQKLKQIFEEKNYLADEFLCSLCSKHKFIKQKNTFENTDCEWPILPLIAQRASCEFLSEFINAIDSVFGIEIIKNMMLVKSEQFFDTALSAAVANGNVKSVLFLLELSEKLGLIEHLIDCAPNFEPFNAFVDNREQDVSKIEAMALFYRDKITKKIGSYKDYDDIAKILHKKYASLPKNTNVLKGNKFAVLATCDNVE